MKKKKTTKKSRSNKGIGGNQNVTERDLEQVEFHRHAMALLPTADSKSPGIAYLVIKKKKEPEWRFCSCNTSKKRTCSHILRLSDIYLSIKKDRSINDDFRSSVWYLMAEVLGQDSDITVQSVKVSQVVRIDDSSTGQRDSKNEKDHSIKVSTAVGEEIFYYFSYGPDMFRLVDRLVTVSEKDTVPNRAKVLKKLYHITLNENETYMLDRGFKTRGMVTEQSVWFRIAYHCFREFGIKGFVFKPAIEESGGLFTVTCLNDSGNALFRLILPRKKVQMFLNVFKELMPNQHDLPIHPIPLKSIFKVTMNTEMDLDVLPFIQLIQENGEKKFFEREDIERFRYGNLVYIKEMGILAELERIDSDRKFRTPAKMTLSKSRIPLFLEEFGDVLIDGSNILKDSLSNLKILKYCDEIEIVPEVIDRSWCWLDVKYGFGNTFISLGEILSVQKIGQRYIVTPEGWVDCESPDLVQAISSLKEKKIDGKTNRLKLSRLDLFQIRASTTNELVLNGNEDRVNLLKRILDLRPSMEIHQMDGIFSELRHYQKLGTEWLLFLFENEFGGLLCDDMGLGKTHQAMAFITLLKELKRISAPCLVVCPTTVISHWTDKIKKHAHNLKVMEYYGQERVLDHSRDHDVLITSYGILRRDIELLKKTAFSVLIFDEIQYIKNPQTQTHLAAKEMDAHMKLGLTGTPVENSLTDLKALLDLTVPGFLGSDNEFISRYMRDNGAGKTGDALKELARRVSPFTLRRLKKRVLSELPEKIEDIRSCTLSEDQVKLYRDAISSRGEDILKVLNEEEEPVPYIHIFALLTLLKQICNHPFLISESGDDVNQYKSGKWDLFREILSESLDSGQKIVVYSQFLGMIEIIEGYLKEQGTGFVTLTGKSRDRGKIINTFNNDPECRVFVGSLKTGGTGIDLVAASVVIHYDRWWNAAREDQATDRVHRIGQNRGVQIFKLITEGTLEEKISAIIERKRNLMDHVVKEDDPGLVKSFSKEDLIDMLSIPTALTTTES